MEDKKLVPKRRFIGFDGEWKGRILDTGVKKIGDGIHGTPKYTLDGEIYFINGNNLLNGSIIFNKDNKKVDKDTQTSNDKLLDKNTILMSINGTIGLLARYQGEDIMLGKSVAYIILNDFKRDYVYYYLKRNQVQKYFTNTLTGSTIKNLSLGAIRMTKIWVPNILEQQKIGKFFKVLDERIANQERKIAKVKALKEAYLTEMFPQEGETAPKRRFAGFDGEWTKKLLGDFGTVEMNKRIFKWQTSDTGDVPFYKIGTFGKKPDAYISYETFKEYKSKYPYPNKGDLLISASGSIGRVVEYMGEDEYFQDSNIVWLKHDGKLNNLFLKQFYKIVKWLGLEGSTIQRLYNKDILETKIAVPPCLEEQQKIGKFFKSLDNQIATEEAKLEKLKKMKEAYLEEMFV